MRRAGGRKTNNDGRARRHKARRMERMGRQRQRQREGGKSRRQLGREKTMRRRGCENRKTAEREVRKPKTVNYGKTGPSDNKTNGRKKAGRQRRRGDKRGHNEKKR